MKLLLVIDSLGSGGAQRQMVELARGLKAAGHTPYVYIYHESLFFKVELDDLNIPIFIGQKKQKWSFRPFLDIRRITKKEGVHVVISFLKSPSIYCELALITKFDIRLVVSERNLDRERSWRTYVRALLHAFSSTVVCNTFSQAKFLEENFFWLRRKICVIENGFVINDKPPAMPMLLEKSSNSELVRLLGVGRIAPQKNILNLIRALNLCRKEGRQVHVDWVGRVDDEALFVLAQKEIVTYGLEENWSWFGESKNIEEFYRRNYDAFILPSLWEGFPNTLCEAMVAGLPVLASAISDIPRIIQDGRTGILFDPADPQDIAAKIKQYAGYSLEERINISSRARALVINNYGIDEMIKKYENVICEKS